MAYRYRHYSRHIQVRCGKCNDWKDERKTKFVNIEEDFNGADVLTFQCPTCKTVQKSRRYG